MYRSKFIARLVVVSPEAILTLFTIAPQFCLPTEFMLAFKRDFFDIGLSFTSMDLVGPSIGLILKVDTASHASSGVEITCSPSFIPLLSRSHRESAWGSAIADKTVKQ